MAESEITMITYQKCVDGDYETKLPRLAKPMLPEILDKKSIDLTSEDLDLLRSIKAKWEEDCDAEFNARRARRQDEQRLRSQFREDLEAEYEMTGHRKADLLFAKAWDRGHSAGMAEVALAYDDLWELVK
jgi:hypothetical protein